MKFDYRKYPITSVVIGICVIVYIYTTLKYGIEMNVYQGIESGGFNPILVIHLKDYYRLITANFIHFGLMHIFCNCYSLWFSNGIFIRTKTLCDCNDCFNACYNHISLCFIFD